MVANYLEYVIKLTIRVVYTHFKNNQDLVHPF